MVEQPKGGFQFGEYRLDTEQQLLLRNGLPIRLAKRPFNVLHYLIENRNRVISRTELLDRFWEGKDVYDDALRKCVGVIRKALQDSSERPRFIETRYAGGYRFIGSAEAAAVSFATLEQRGLKIVIEEEEIEGPAAPSDEAAFQSRPAIGGVSARTFRMVAVSTILILLTVGVTALVVKNDPRSDPQPRSAALGSVAVMPLKNLTGDSSQDYFSDGVTESLISQLSKVEGLKVISRGSVFTFKERAVDPREVGKRLGVATLLEGSVQKKGDRIKVAVRLVSAQDGHVIWSHDGQERSVSEIFFVQDEIACGVAAELKAKFCGEQPLASKGHATNIDAYRAYLKGRYFMSQQTGSLGPEKALLTSVEYFQQAIALDPTYSPAYAGLADSYTQLNWFVAEDPRSVIAKAKNEALKAIAIDEVLPEAHTALATAYLHEWNFAEAEREHRRSLALNPGNGWAHHEYSTHLMAVGRIDEMLAEMARAEELDPLNTTIMADRGSMLYFADRYDEAITQFRRSAEEMGAPFSAFGNIGMCHLEQQLFEEAIRDFQSSIAVRGRTSDTVTWLAVGYAKGGRKAEARRLLEEVKQLSRKQYVPKTFFAFIHAALGEKEKAFEMLDTAFEQHDINLLGLKTHPWLDSLRSDARFQKLIARIGLPA